ncbi:DUF6064 family protein [Methylophaga sp. OBS1]|uniref:DUF6064 family protein n=1 Tax=Methylophaga sp. OBS1 TaxID=2991933 RepID=UPI0022549148|nr:DUF6064 family protein [Methylophaga sp. OBS1]MCX4191486.1 DUF6064 family protein [Methylophaga sp. OBS1]MCX4191569.1 DUF6064 family protein [Methylophaga sp. OBS1]
MSTGLSYSLQDFIPFTADIYFRLLERMSESYWPLQLLTMILGMVSVWLALHQRARIVSLLMAPLWAFVAVAFFIQLYAELNWAGRYMAYAFFIQAGLLLTAFLSPGFNSSPGNAVVTFLASIIALSGLIGLPVAGLLMTGNWWQAEVFGVFPDPTSVTTLGLALVLFRGWRSWLMTLIPILWLSYSGLTLWALDIPTAIMLFVTVGLALIGLVWRSVERRVV